MRNTLMMAALGLASLASPASAEVILKSDSGFVVRVAGEVAATPAEAWNAFIAPAQWWNSAHTFSADPANLTLDANANGCFCEKMPAPKNAPAGQRAGSVMHMRVLYAEPYRALRMSGGLGPLQSEAVVGTMTVTFKYVDGPTGKGTRILWEYVVGGYMRYKTDTISAAVDKVLRDQLAGLIKFAGPIVTPPQEAPVQGNVTSEIISGNDAALIVGPSDNDAAAGASVSEAMDKLFKPKQEQTASE